MNRLYKFTGRTMSQVEVPDPPIHVLPTVNPSVPFPWGNHIIELASDEDTTIPSPPTGNIPLITYIGYFIVLLGSNEFESTYGVYGPPDGRLVGHFHTYHF